MPFRKRQNLVEWQQENKSSTPSVYSLLDFTKCYGHREAYYTPHEIMEWFESNVVSKLAKDSLKNPILKQEYARVKQAIEQRIYTVNAGYKSGFVSSDKVLIKCYNTRVDIW